MKTLLKHTFFLLDNAIKKNLPFLIAIFLISSLLDTINIGLISVFLTVMVNYSSFVKKFPLAFQHLLTQFSEMKTILIIGLILIFSFLLKIILNIYTQKKIVLSIAQFTIRLKIRLMKRFQEADYVFHLQQNSAYLLNKISMVDTFSNNIIATSLNMISSILMLIGVMACLMILYPLITLLLFFVISLIFVIYEFLIKNKIIKAGKLLSLSNGKMSQSILQAIHGMKEIRVFGIEPFFLNKMQHSTQEYSDALSIYHSLQLIPRSVTECIAAIFLVGSMIGALCIGTSPVNMIPTLGVFAAACMRFLPIVSRLMMLFTQFRSATYTAEILYSEMYKKPIPDSALLSGNVVQSLSTNSPLSFLEFSLNDVSFSYPHSKLNALTKINLNVHRGQTVGLTGASGAGKSTLVYMFLGLIHPTSGRLLVDGIPVNTNLREWLNNFAYIPQSIFITDDTLKRNIAFGIDDVNIDDVRIAKSIKMAQLSDVVLSLKDGVDTQIGENGIRLSGGQRQRVALARAIYYDRNIIIMDEATSALDNETERELIEAMKALHGIKTIIIIAHRVSTLRYCDVIYRLEQGKIGDVKVFLDQI